MNYIAYHADIRLEKLFLRQRVTIYSKIKLHYSLV